jgi:hypothetical protein
VTTARRTLLVAGVVCGAGAVAAVLWLRSPGAPALPAWLARAVGARAAPRALRMVPEGTRVKVEVLNATGTRGLARLATLALRDAGFDVVYFGNTPERRDSTLVLDRSGHPDWAGWAGTVMYPAAVATRADSGRLVDLTVIVGRGWRPPAEPLRP